MRKIIAVIDDNRNDIKILKGNLVNAKLDVLEINPTNDIFKQLQENPPHLILTEIQCGGQDMLEVIEHFKKIQVYSDIPAFVFSSDENIKTIGKLKKNIFIRALPKNKRWGGVLNEINSILRETTTKRLVKRFDLLLAESKGKLFEMGSVIGVGETSFMFASDLSFRPNILLQVNNPILDLIKYNAGVLKTIRSQPLLNARYKYKTKCSLPGISESSLQLLRKWMYDNCQRRV